MSSRYPISRKYAKSWQHHVARYVFALPYCYRRKVMDAGCQNGWGAHLLSYVSTHVTFVDISPRGISESKALHKPLCPADYIIADFEKEFPEGKWDVITAFEVIEHLQDPTLFLQSIQEALNPGGRFIFSVPHMVEAQDHKQLYDENRIRTLISGYFKIEEFYIQDKEIMSGRPMYKNLKCYIGVATPS